MFDNNKERILIERKLLTEKESINFAHEIAPHLKKGDVLACARIAGITGAKRTSELIPLCHNIFIDKISVDFDVKSNSIEITVNSVCVGKTGIEMESLTAVSVAALTIYDMCKAVDKEMKIENIHLVEKTKEKIL